MSVNFQLTFPLADPGWHVLPHGPYSIFVDEQTSTKLQLRGAVNNLISDANSTPDLDRDNIAKLIGGTTLTLRQHAGVGRRSRWTRSWKRTTPKTDWFVGRKGTNVIVTAFAVKGNTTVLISLSGRAGHSAEVDKALSQFDNFLSRMKLTQANLDL